MDDQVALLVDAIAAPLSRLLSVNVDTVRGDVASLTLNVGLIRGAKSSDKIAAAMRALSQLLHASHNLHRSSTQTTRFWHHVLQDARLFVNRTATANALSDSHLSIPHIVLDCSRVKVHRELIDELASFFLDGVGSSSSASTSHSTSTVYEHSQVAVTLRFARCQLGASELLLLHKHLLQRVASAEPLLRQLRIHALDVGDNGLGASDLQALATVLQQQTSGGGLDALVLENALGRFTSAHSLDGFRAVIRSAFDVDTRMRPSLTGTRPSRPSRSLKRLDLQANALGADAFAAVGSAFRYTHGVQSLTLARTLSVVDPTEREQCWRWLAFGTFAQQRPRASSSSCRVVTRCRIDLSGNVLFPNDVAALQRVFAHPAAELLAHCDYGTDDDNTITAATTAGRMCRVVSGSTLFAAPRVDATLVRMLDHDAELELLGTLATAWVCVVVPGVGLGWTSTACVEFIDGVTNGDDTIANGVDTVANGVDTVANGVDTAPQVLYDLVLNRLVESETTTRALVALLETIGSQLFALELRHNRALDAQVIATILLHCPRLERLDLEDCGLSDAMMHSVVNALYGELGGRLRALNVSSNYLGVAFVTQLARVLARTGVGAAVPVLQELRLYNCPLGDIGLARLRDVLAMNKTLATLEIGPLREPSVLTRAERIEYWLNAAFDSERLPLDTSLALAHRLAFLSVTVNASGARSMLDTYTLTTILQFAGSQSHRRVLWQR